MRVYLVRHRGPLDVEGSIATHRLVGEWGGVTDETLVEATSEAAGGRCRNGSCLRVRTRSNPVPEDAGLLWRLKQPLG